MSVSITNHYNSVPISYEGTIKSNGKGGQRFDRELLQKQGEKLPSFVGKVYTEEELYQYVDDKVRQNQSNNKNLEDMIKDSCIGWESATFKFVGEAKTYTYFDFIREMEKRSENSSLKDKPIPQSAQETKEQVDFSRFAPNAPEKVKQAFMEASQETGYSAYDGAGKLSAALEK